MIKGKDIIVFSDDWGRNPFSCQHIMQRLLPHNRLLWINTIGMRNPRFSLYDIRRSMEKITGWFQNREEVKTGSTPNLKIVSPFMTPYQNIPAIRSFNKTSVINEVKAGMGELGFKNPIVVATVPNAGDYAGAFSEKLLVYYCVDDFTQWPGVDRRLVSDMEEKLLQSSDLVFASADALCEKKGQRGKKVLLLPHGVDFDHFDKGASESGRPSVFDSIPGPVIGFFGAISPWLDFQMLISLAESNPQWSFVFVGPADTEVGSLDSLPNVFLIGKVPYADLPAYAGAFDAAIIPFLVNELTVSVNPLKLLEYMACGLPVVSTDLPEVRKFASHISIAKTAPEFAAGLEAALASDTHEKRLLRKAIAREYSWETVAEQFSSQIECLLGSRQVCPN